jgi:hypothetical protein
MWVVNWWLEGNISVIWEGLWEFDQSQLGKKKERKGNYRLCGTFRIPKRPFSGPDRV